MCFMPRIVNLKHKKASYFEFIIVNMGKAIKYYVLYAANRKSEIGKY